MDQVNSKMKFEELLTPYVQNRLDETKRKYVEELAKADSEFNEMLQFEIQLASCVRQTNEEFKEVTPSFHELKQRIESSSNKFNWLHVFSWNNGKPIGKFNSNLVLASLAIVCVGTYMLFSQHADNHLTNDYETLSTGKSTVAYKNDRQYLRVVIAKELVDSQVKDLSNELVFNIESGPDSLNSYIISLAGKNTLPENTLQRWRNDPRFLLIEPLPGADTEN